MGPVISVEDVHFSYGADPVLSGVTFDVAPRTFVALAGANGSGKSTLLRVMLGLLPASRGRITILGHPPGRLSEGWRVGYVPQRSPALNDLPATVREVVATGRLARRGWVR